MKASHTSQTDIITSNQHAAQLAIAEHNGDENDIDDIYVPETATTFSFQLPQDFHFHSKDKTEKHLQMSASQKSNHEGMLSLISLFIFNTNNIILFSMKKIHRKNNLTFWVGIPKWCWQRHRLHLNQGDFHHHQHQLHLLHRQG